MKTLAKYIALLVIPAFALIACEQEGPAEKAGEKIDNAVDKAKEKVEEAGDKVEEKTDELRQ